MPTVKIPIEDEMERTSVAGASSSHVWSRSNLLPMRNGQQVIRPGIYNSSYDFATAAMVQLRAYQRNTTGTLVNFIGVANYKGIIVALLGDGSTIITAVLTGTLTQDHDTFPISFCQDNNKFVIAKGTSLAYGIVAGSTITTPTNVGFHPRYAGGDAKINKVLAFDNYFLATRVAGPEFYWTDAGSLGLPDPSLWPALNMAQAFSGEEPIMDAHILGNQIIFIGTQHIEVWENDGVNPFSPTPGGKHRIGGFSITGLSTITDGSLYFIDNEWRLVKYSGGSIETIDNPFAKELRDVSLPYYGEMSCITMYNEKFLVISVINIGNYVYNIDSKKWCGWSYGSAGSYLPVCSFIHLGPNYRYADRIICGTTQGSISGFIDSCTTDTIRGYSAETVIGNLTTRPIDNGTGARKRTRELRARVSGKGVGFLDIKCCDAGTISSAWGATKSITIGNTQSNTAPGGTVAAPVQGKICRLGTYKSRMYSFTIYGQGAAFSDVEEDLEVLR